MPGGKQFFRGMLVPGVGAFFFEPFHDVAQRREIFQPLAARVAIKNDDRHAPETLPRDAPVRPLLDHFVNAFFAPRGHPFHRWDFVKRSWRNVSARAVRGLIHLDEPLLGGAENHRIVAAPAVRIAVLVSVLAEQRAAIAQQFHDDGIRLEDVFAFVFRQAFEIDAAIIDGA